MSAHFQQPWRSARPPLVHVGRTADGYTVYDRPNSHRHLPDATLMEALARTRFGSGAFAKHLVRLEAKAALSDCIPTAVTDQIVFARRPTRHGLTRFVLHRKPESTSVVSVILKAMEQDTNGLILISAYAGDAEPEPWDRHATAQSLCFWSSHALIWGSCEVELGTLTLTCPWSV